MIELVFEDIRDVFDEALRPGTTMIFINEAVEFEGLADSPLL
jgi:hypothetical protein